MADPDRSGSRRPTIADVARRAQVTKSAVSYALNDKPGVSPTTRRRILAAADELGWRPSAAARALMGRRSRLMGLVVNRPARLIGLEPWYMELISGLQEVHGPLGVGLALQLVDLPEDEAAALRDWAGRRQVDAVALTDVGWRDPRLEMLAGLGLPGVVLSPPWPGDDDFGPPAQPSRWPWLWIDDTVGARLALRYLAALGHRRIARVAGPADYAHTIARDAALAQEASRLGLSAPQTVTADYSQERGGEAVRGLLIAPDRPSAIIFDNDIMAAAALQVAHELNLTVPDDLSLVAWDDSIVARLTAPALTAVKTDVRAYGMRLAEAMNQLADAIPVASGPVGTVGLEVRGSTATAL